MMGRSLVQGASEPNQNIGLGAAWLAVVLGLALVRLLSEYHTSKRQETRMNVVQKHDTNSTTKTPRKFWQYLLETIWATRAGVLAARWPP